MGCSICTNLERVFKTRHREFMTTCSEAFRRVSSKRMAYAAVERERARSELEMHRKGCIYANAAAAVSAGDPCSLIAF